MELAGQGRSVGRSSLAGALAVVLLMLLSGLLPVAGGAAQERTTLEPSSIPKFTNQLDGPPAVFTPLTMLDPATGLMTDHYTIIESEFYQQILPTVDAQGRPTNLAATKVWGYGGLAHDAVTGKQLGFVRSAPSPTIEATQGRPTNVAWVNSIYTPYLYAADSSIDQNDQNRSGTAIYPVTTTVHVMGMESSSMYDGHPYSWVTWNGLHGPEYYTYSRTVPNGMVYHYDNIRSPGTLWFHDRAIGLTRSNCYSGLTGFYILEDPLNVTAVQLPSGKYDVPLSIQDRNFFSDGSLKLPTQNLPDPANMTANWLREFYGDVITVNGLAWPNMEVDRGMYMFRLLDGSDGRWYDLSLSNGMTFTVLARDGVYLEKPLTVSHVVVAPGERYDVLMDFSSYAPGTKIVMRNAAPASYPLGRPVDANTGVVMQFTVGSEFGYDPAQLPDLDPLYVPVQDDEPVAERTFTLFDFLGEAGDSMASLDGQLFRSAISERPVPGTTELWTIVDSTRDSHAIEVGGAHLKVVSRQGYYQDGYDRDWIRLNGGYLPFRQPTLSPDLDNYLTGSPVPPSPLDAGWSDLVTVHPFEVVTVLVRFGPIDGRSSYSFDMTAGPTYIWYSHILDHEENEMMRQIRPGW